MRFKTNAQSNEIWVLGRMGERVGRGGKDGRTGESGKSSYLSAYFQDSSLLYVFSVMLSPSPHKAVVTAECNYYTALT